MLRKASILAGLWLAAVASAQLRASQYDILINEISYNPFSGDDRDEFVEIYNRGARSINLSGWFFAEGLDFAFPAGTSLGPGEYLVVARDAAHFKDRFGIENVVGNFTARLDNGGEIISLASASGVILNRIHYGDSGAWPSSPDGLGPTLELMTPHQQFYLPQAWASSLVLEGTPGRQNSRFALEESSLSLIVEEDLFQNFKGAAGEPSTPITRWTEPGFNASAWPEAQGAFGVGGSYTFNTELSDLPNNYTTFYIRRSFDIDAATLEKIRSGALGLSLIVRYDDGFVAYLNGVEVGRVNLGTPGVPVAHNAVADSRIDDGLANLSLDEAGDLLLPTGNVLAVVCANGAIGSGDFLLGVQLVAAPSLVSGGEASRTVTINEVRPAGGGLGFIELHNRTAAAVPVGGWWIVDSRGSRFRIPDGTSIGAGGFASFGEAQLGFAPSLEARYTLLPEDAATWVDGINPRLGPAGASFGRWPDGDEDQFLMPSPTRGGANVVALEANVVINEILYHPVFVAPTATCTRQCSDADQWIELHNRGATSVDVSGWSLSKAIEFMFLPGTTIPAKGFIVVAADRARFLAKYSSVPASRVFGSWQKSLARSSDTINLNDALGNRVDHVEYGDGEPINDEEPADGVDDGTSAASDWPKAADDGALGRSIELANPSLDNRAGAAWAAGSPGGTPCAQNSTYGVSPPPVAWDVSIEPVVPKGNDPVRVTCRASSVSGIAGVEALWHLDPAGPVATAALRDDGLSGDRLAGDGLYGGWIPAQASGSMVAFQLRVLSQGGASTTIPRPPEAAPYVGFQGPYFLYPVDDSVPPANGSVTYRIVMTAADHAELMSRPVTSNVLLPCTFIGDGEAHFNVGIRIRGAYSRYDDRKSWRVDLPPERKFRGMMRLNFLASDIEHEIIAADIFRRAGIPVSQEWTVNLVLQDVLDPLCVFKENFDEDFLDRNFGGSSGGNLYRGVDPGDDGSPPTGDLTYYGPVSDPQALAAYVETYEKKSNREEADYSDIAELCRAFDTGETPDGAFADRLSALIDVDEWARFFAVQACLSNADGGIYTGNGEDYFVYRVPENAPRPDAGKFLILPWDIGETFSSATERLFRPDVRAIRRFLTHPAFAPLYYANLVDLRDGAFSRFEIRQTYYLIDRLFSFATVDGIDSYVPARLGFFDENVPSSLSSGFSATGVTTPLIEVGEVWRYFKGTQEPSGGNTSWATRAFNDSTWLEGATGIGYGDSGLATVLDDMADSYTTVYARKKFQVADPAAVGSLFLQIDYDDGFVAYLNGTEVARGSVGGQPGSFLPYNSVGIDHEAGVPETFDLTSSKGLLVAGTNVLAIQALNRAINSGDLQMTPALLNGEATSGGGCGTLVYATSARVTLSGRSNAVRTHRVTVNGAPATFDPYRATWTATLTVPLGETTVRVEAFDALAASIGSIDVKVIRISRSFTDLKGTLASSTTLTEAGSPYVISADLIVPTGLKLTIEPGVAIFGQTNASIIVHGLLDALGTSEKPIRLQSLACDGRMGGMAFDGTGNAGASPTNRLRFFEFEHGNRPSGYEGVIGVNVTKLLLEDCKVRDMPTDGVNGVNSRVEIHRSIFDRVWESVHVHGSTTVAIFDSTFSNTIGDSDVLSLKSGGLNGERPRVERCLLEYGFEDGIDTGNYTVDIRDNVFRFLDKAISLEENGPEGLVTVTGNIIHDCGMGIAVKNGIRIDEGSHNTIVGCQEGISLYRKSGGSDGGHAVFDSMIVWDNIWNVTVDENSSVSFTYSNIGGEVWPGTGNISLDPGFAAAAQDDFSLSAGSPAIGTGKGGSDMGAIPYTGTMARFLRGDADANQKIEISDAIRCLEYLFRSGAAPSCLDRLDTNDDGSIDISDPVYLLLYMFAGGKTPPPPFSVQGTDPTADALKCI